MSKKVEPSVIRSLLEYNKDTGKLTWRSRSRDLFSTDKSWKIWNTRFAGKEAFTADDGRGYRQGRILGNNYLAHRVVWACVTGEWPRYQIDHINGHKSDNRISNLRDVPESENKKNLPLPRSNSSGSLGVYWCKQKAKWHARIRVDGSYKHLGFFSDVGTAAAVVAAAKADYGYHVNHGRSQNV